MLTLSFQQNRVHVGHHATRWPRAKLWFAKGFCMEQGLAGQSQTHAMELLGGTQDQNMLLFSTLAVDDEEKD